MKMQKKNNSGGVWVGGGGRVGCGVRVDVNEEVKFCENAKKKRWVWGVWGWGWV